MYADPEGLDSEHIKNKRPSTKEKHEKGQATKDKSRGGEKGDERRREPRKRPPGWKGKWPPLPSIPFLPGNTCIMFPEYCGDPDVADAGETDMMYESVSAEVSSAYCMSANEE